MFLVLPTRVNLIKRVPIDSVFYPFCTLLLEMGVHVFVECEFAQNIWEYFGLDLLAIWTKFTVWKEWLCNVRELFVDAICLAMMAFGLCGRPDAVWYL